MNTSLKKGFTLIELLIVIGILAVLATLTILVLNPAQLFAQARDSQRLSDFRTLQSAITFSMTTASSSALWLGPTTGRVTSGTACGFTANSGVCTTNAATAVDATGWVALDFRQATGGAPVSRLPIDPTNSGNFVYAYVGIDSTSGATARTYEINSRLESQKYQPMMASDGGDDSTCSSYTETTCWYEAGTAPGLAL